MMLTFGGLECYIKKISSLFFFNESYSKCEEVEQEAAGMYILPPCLPRATSKHLYYVVGSSLLDLHVV